MSLWIYVDHAYIFIPQWWLFLRGSRKEWPSKSILYLDISQQEYVYNEEENMELQYMLSKMIPLSLSNYYSKFMLMIEMMIKYSSHLTKIKESHRQFWEQGIDKQ